VLYDVVDRDGEVGGGIIAGALAYRFFIWLLPYALVLVAGVGLAASATSTTPEEAARHISLSGLVSRSVATAADGKGRVYAIVIGIPLLVYATRSLLRALIGTHRLAWTDLRRSAPRPTLGSTLLLLAMLVLTFAVAALAGAARAWTAWAGIVATLLLVVPFTGIWLVVTSRLPHRGAPWQALLPGAVLFGFGIQVVAVLGTYVLALMALSKQGTYGTLGAAAALLFELYVVARVIVGAAVLNATLWERRQRRE
jgi:membrane protein